MARKPLLQSRVEHATKEAVEDYAENNDLSQSEAVRRLIQSGLAQEGYNVEGSRSWLERIASVRTILSGTSLLVISAIIYTASYASATSGFTTAAVIMIVLGTATLVVSLVLTTSAALAQLALARPLRRLVGLGEKVGT